LREVLACRVPSIDRKEESEYRRYEADSHQELSNCGSVEGKRRNTCGRWDHSLTRVRCGGQRAKWGRKTYLRVAGAVVVVPRCQSMLVGGRGREGVVGALKSCISGSSYQYRLFSGLHLLINLSTNLVMKASPQVYASKSRNRACVPVSRTKCPCVQA